MPPPSGGDARGRPACRRVWHGLAGCAARGSGGRLGGARLGPGGASWSSGSTTWAHLACGPGPASARRRFTSGIRARPGPRPTGRRRDAVGRPSGPPARLEAWCLAVGAWLRRPLLRHSATGTAGLALLAGAGLAAAHTRPPTHTSATYTLGLVGPRWARSASAPGPRRGGAALSARATRTARRRCAQTKGPTLGGQSTQHRLPTRWVPSAPAPGPPQRASRRLHRGHPYGPGTAERPRPRAAVHPAPLGTPVTDPDASRRRDRAVAPGGVPPAGHPLPGSLEGLRGA